MNVVADSTPLISLAAIGALNLLQSLYGEIIIPEAVYREVTVAGMPGAVEISRSPWIKRHSVTDRVAVEGLLRKARLDDGESEAHCPGNRNQSHASTPRRSGGKRVRQTAAIARVWHVGLAFSGQSTWLDPFCSSGLR